MGRSVSPRWQNDLECVKEEEKSGEEGLGTGPSATCDVK